MPMFNNSCIKPIRHDKPHIVLIGNYWRVSKVPKPAYKYADLFNKAHAFAARLNNARHTK